MVQLSTSRFIIMFYRFATSNMKQKFTYGLIVIIISATILQHPSPPKKGKKQKDKRKKERRKEKPAQHQNSIFRFFEKVSAKGNQTQV